MDNKLTTWINSSFAPNIETKIKNHFSKICLLNEEDFTDIPKGFLSCTMKIQMQPAQFISHLKSKEIHISFRLLANMIGKWLMPTQRFKV
ncbi:hypothetical protein A616_16645 [Brevibacillus brevis X23]|nr:hypothetical protein A616_16645 [Brevibacillus brevis X23]